MQDPGLMLALLEFDQGVSAKFTVDQQIPVSTSVMLEGLFGFSGLENNFRIQVSVVFSPVIHYCGNVD